MWSKCITRRLAVQVAQAWNFGWGEIMQKTLGVSVKNTLVFRDRKKTDYYVDEGQYKKYIAGLYHLLERGRFLNTFHSRAKTRLETILKKIKMALNKNNLSHLTSKELIKLYRDFIIPNHNEFFVWMWTVFNLGEPLANMVQKHLQKYLTNEEQITQYLLKLSSPLVSNDVLNERMDILKLALGRGRLDKKELEEKIKRHTTKYRHIPMFDFDHAPYSESYFRKELAKIRHPELELKELRRLFIHRKREFKRIITIIKPERKSKKLFYFLKEAVWLRDYRDMLRQKLNLELAKFYTEVGRRLRLTLPEVATLTNDEIVKYLKANKPFPQNEIRRREKAFLLIQKGKKAKLYSGAAALAKAKQELKNETIYHQREIMGVIGSSGKARGTVKIVYTNKDLPKVKKGDVMVATMTRQDFVPSMRKAAAVITDEGSVTAHAAIIARELGIPCIVATKIATKVLKDKDLVEVDATKGIIKLIKS